MSFRYELPNDISGWVKYLAKSNATVVNSPAGPTLRMARNSANPVLPASKARQTVAKMLVEQFGSIEEVNEEIGKIRRGKGEGGKLVEIWEKMNALDDRVEVKELFKNLQADLPALEELLERNRGEWGYEDPIYRFYHQSFKVYGLQRTTLEIVAKLQALAPDRPLDDWFMHIVGEGTGKKWKEEDNQNWLAVTRPIVEAFFHARYFLEMAVKYGKELKAPKRSLPSGWAALLYLYNLRYRG